MKTFQMYERDNNYDEWHAVTIYYDAKGRSVRDQKFKAKSVDEAISLFKRHVGEEELKRNPSKYKLVELVTIEVNS